MLARERSGSPLARRRRAFYRFARRGPAEMAETGWNGGRREAAGAGGETGRCVRNGTPAASRPADARRHATETRCPHAARTRCRRCVLHPHVRGRYGCAAAACSGHSSVKAVAGIGVSCSEAVPSATVISRCGGDCGFCVKDCKTPSRKPASLSRIDTPLMHAPAGHCRRGEVAVRAGQAVKGGSRPLRVRAGTAGCDCPMRVRP